MQNNLSELLKYLKGKTLAKKFFKDIKTRKDILNKISYLKTVSTISTFLKGEVEDMDGMLETQTLFFKYAPLSSVDVDLFEI